MNGIQDWGYDQRKIYPFLLYKSDSIIITCNDDYIILAKDYEKVKEIITFLQENFKLTDEVDLSIYLGIGITKNPNGSLILSQLFLIDRIIKYLSLQMIAK